jgi:hypothetical protein
MMAKWWKEERKVIRIGWKVEPEDRLWLITCEGTEGAVACPDACMFEHSYTAPFNWVQFSMFDYCFMQMQNSYDA